MPAKGPAGRHQPLSMQLQNLLSAIQDVQNRLRKSEQKVAAYVLANPKDIVHMRIVDLAQEAHVSEPTVIRFCRAIGCSGFQDFKLRLARHIATDARFGRFEAAADDTTARLSQKVFDATIGALITLRDEIDPSALEQAILLLAAARRIEFYGFGASGAVAADAQDKFFRLRVASTAYSDPHIQHMSAQSLDPGDVVVAISQTGRTQALLHSVRLALNAGTSVIAIAPSRSPLAEVATVAIHINASQHNDMYTPLTSRIAHLVVIDVLATGVAASRGPALTEHLATLRDSLEQLREPQPATDNAPRPAPRRDSNDSG